MKEESSAVESAGGVIAERRARSTRRSRASAGGGTGRCRCVPETGGSVGECCDGVAQHFLFWPNPTFTRRRIRQWTSRGRRGALREAIDVEDGRIDLGRRQEGGGGHVPDDLWRAEESDDDREQSGIVRIANLLRDFPLDQQRQRHGRVRSFQECMAQQRRGDVVGDVRDDFVGSEGKGTERALSVMIVGSLFR
jgi:hypothetical protein